jgi:tellurite methyltransferase
MPNTPFWETTYQDFAVSSFGKPSQEFYDLIHRLPPHAKVLDLGCGEGRNALFLAEHGCEVTAVDISVSGIQKLHHWRLRAPSQSTPLCRTCGRTPFRIFLT